MDFEKTKAFLRQQEERMARIALEIPINVNLWKEKSADTYSQLAEYQVICEAMLLNRRDNGLMNTLEKVRDLNIESIQSSCKNGIVSYHELPGSRALNEDFRIEVIEKFLDVQYEPPEDLYELRDHFVVYSIYQTYTYQLLGFFYPTVNDFINYAGVKLVRDSCQLLMSAFAKGIKQEHAIPGGNARKNLSNAQNDAIGNILTELRITDLQVFRADKNLRRNFLEKCRNKTKEIDREFRKVSEENSASLSDDRILKKAREILKGNASI